MDDSAIFIAEGGINKDSGYILFSPHASLHLKAAALAINHTELFFENIRNEIGDKEFANFLQLEIDNKTLSSASDSIICSASMIQINFDVMFLINVCFLTLNYIIDLNLLFTLIK